MQNSHIAACRFDRPEAEAFAHFAEHGFVVIENILAEQEVEKMIAALEAAAARDGSHQRGASVYARRNLLDSGPTFRVLMDSASIRNLVEPVLGRRAIAVKGTLFDKTPEANWKVAWHQDTTICVSERKDQPGFGGWSVKEGVVNVQAPADVLSAMMTIRLHLDDCEEENGAMRVLAGSPRTGRLNADQIDQWRQEQPAVTCAVRRGGALLIRPLTLHASAAAKIPRHRRVLHLEFAADGLPGGLAWAVMSCPGMDRAAS